MKIQAIICSMILTATCMARPQLPAPPLTIGTGLSGLANPEQAGTDAAKAARAQLGETPAKAVIVFAGRKQLTPELIKGISSVFKADLIWGCEGYSPLTSKGNLPSQKDADGVAVLAIAGDVTVTAVSEAVKGKAPGDFTACGEELGRKVKAALTPAAQGKVILTFGNQHVGDNAHYVRGLTTILGSETTLVGAAAGNADAREIVAGKIVRGENVCILLQGAFVANTALATGNGKDGLLTAAKTALSSAFHPENKPLLAFIFDCGGRRGDLLANRALADEHTIMKTITGEVPLFGFYGGGEIGNPGDHKAPIGVGYNIVTCVIHAH